MEKQIKTNAQLVALLEKVTMRNTIFFASKWRFEVVLNTDPSNLGWFVNLAFERPDTDTGVVGTGRGRKEFIAVDAWASSVVKTAWVLIEMLARHEIMEAFTVQGCEALGLPEDEKRYRPFNPHYPIAKLALVGCTE